MPLDWDLVTAKYRDGATISTLVGNRQLHITSVGDDGIHCKWDVVQDCLLSRRNLERAVELLEDGTVRADPVTITSDYRTLVADERPTTAAAVLKDLGYLPATNA
ncbi:MAG: hypothetical protein R2736_08310 [Solirubrobacterales bacterium]|jgi:hypothetical protein